jgi:hypothetical protein
MSYSGSPTSLSNYKNKKSFSYVFLYFLGPILKNLLFCNLQLQLIITSQSGLSLLTILILV